MANIPQLAPDSRFPQQAVDDSVQVQPPPNGAQYGGTFLDTIVVSLATAADSIIPWGKSPRARDKMLRNFWPTESFMAGAVANVSFRNAAFDWEVQSPSNSIVSAVTDMLMGAMAGDSFGWVPFLEKVSVDLYTQDNGTFIELIRDPSMDANSKFKGPMAPVLGIAHLDSNQCLRTGNMEWPVLYQDREGREHKMAWYQVIPFSDLPSPIERMNGLGYCSVTRALRLAQIMRSIGVYKDEKISGRHAKAIHIVGGVSRVDIDDAKKRGFEEADNKGQARYIDPIILASLDPEKPVSVATLDFANLPDGFDFGTEMQWYISGLALDFGVDYQEFAPLPGGGIGSSAQSVILHKKSSGKGPATFMRTISEAFKNYGVLPRNATLVFSDKGEQDALEKQEVRTKAIEEAAIAVNSKILTPEAAARDMVERGIYTKETIDQISPEFWKMGESQPPAGQPIGNRGGNTLAEDAGRTNSGKNKPTAGGLIKKILGRE